MAELRGARDRGRPPGWRGVAVPLKVYAHCIDGQADAANKRITEPDSGDEGDDDSARRRLHGVTALSKAVSDGTEISVSGIARAVGVDRTFFYRHRDLLAQLHALEAAPPAAGSTAGSASLRNACRKPSASKPGANPDSARPPTPTPSTRRSSIWNSGVMNKYRNRSTWKKAARMLTEAAERRPRYFVRTLGLGETGRQITGTAGAV